MAEVMRLEARGYIASGPFRGIRVPQHIQNQIVKTYAEKRGYSFVLSRAEYSFKKEAYSQLRSALRDGYEIVVLFSLWLLPRDAGLRRELIREALGKGLELHFACEEEFIVTPKDASRIDGVLELDGVFRDDSASLEGVIDYLRNASEHCRQVN